MDADIDLHTTTNDFKFKKRKPVKSLESSESNAKKAKFIVKPNPVAVAKVKIPAKLINKPKKLSASKKLAAKTSLKAHKSGNNAVESVGVHKHAKSSSIFTSNPAEVDISKIMSEPVCSREEAVFSEATYADCPLLHPHLIACLRDRLQITKMTAIQQKAIPRLLTGADALLKAQTGSGKSLAYLLPMIQSLQAVADPPITRKSGTLALVLLPTRELAFQTQEVLSVILRPFVRIVSGLCTGGTRKKAQKASLRKGINILVATPSRLLDHVRTSQKLELAHLRWLVIDEADRLVEMGFEQQVRQVKEHIETQRQAQNVETAMQTVLLSATLSAGVDRLAGLAMRKPERIEVGDGTNDQFILPSGLKHYLLMSPLKMRLVLLLSFLLLKGKYSSVAGKIIVFMGTQHSVDFHYRLLTETICKSSPDEDADEETGSQLLCWRLHGSMDHTERVQVFRDFSRCVSAGVLLTTDVAARGIDVPAVHWVLQYSAPGTVVDYIHRVGRTARAGSHGKALLLLAPHEAEYVGLLRRRGIDMVNLEVEDITSGALVHARQRGKPLSAEKACVSLQRQMEDVIHGDKGLLRLAERAFLSSLRAYASFSTEAKQCFSFKLMHKGHFAKSFGIRDTPSAVARHVKHGTEEDREEVTNYSHSAKSSRVQGSERLPRKTKSYNDYAKSNMLSEFASGI